MPEPLLPLAQWTNDALGQLQPGAILQALGDGVGTATGALQAALATGPWWLLPLCLGALALGRRRIGLALFVVAALGLVEALGFGGQMRDTLAQVGAATLISLGVGIPAGILAGHSPRLAAWLRPMLDFMQTMPAFVYLIPAVMLFGLGVVPAVLATVIFAVPPVVRLTTAGIRGVEREVLEAGRILGAGPWQLLLCVRLPYALPAIMAGVNQTIMMALSMVIVASMVGGGGLGGEVLSGIQRLDMGQGFASGLSVVLLAMVLDRLTEALLPAFGPAHDTR